MNIQLLIFLLFAIASAAIIFFLESSNHEPLELRSTSALTMDNIEPTLKEFGAKQIRFTDNWVQFNYDGDDFIVGLSAKPIVRLYFAWYLDDSDDLNHAKSVAEKLCKDATGFGFTVSDDRKVIISVSSVEPKRDGLLDSLPYMILALRSAVLVYLQEYETAKAK